MSDRNAGYASPLAQQLMQEYGPLLPASAAMKLLGYSSTNALRQARLRRRLPIPMFKIAGRRGWFASTSEVASWIDEVVTRATR